MCNQYQCGKRPQTYLLSVGEAALLGSIGQICGHKNIAITFYVLIMSWFGMCVIKCKKRKLASGLMT